MNNAIFWTSVGLSIANSLTLGGRPASTSSLLLAIALIVLAIHNQKE